MVMMIKKTENEAKTRFFHDLGLHGHC